MSPLFEFAVLRPALQAESSGIVVWALVLGLALALLVVWWLMRGRASQADDERPAAPSQPAAPPAPLMEAPMLAEAAAEAPAPVMAEAAMTPAEAPAAAEAAPEMAAEAATEAAEAAAPAAEPEMAATAAPEAESAAAPAMAAAEPAADAPVMEAAEAKPAEMAAPEAEAEPAPEEAAAEPAQPDDLTRIEGIGPKIAALLQSKGITTFEQLGAARLAHLRAILAEGGVSVADPATWPQQARLAAKGRWKQLKALQDELHGGRRV